MDTLCFMLFVKKLYKCNFLYPLQQPNRGFLLVSLSNEKNGGLEKLGNLLKVT